MGQCKYFGFWGDAAMVTSLEKKADIVRELKGGRGGKRVRHDGSGLG